MRRCLSVTQSRDSKIILTEWRSVCVCECVNQGVGFGASGEWDQNIVYAHQNWMGRETQKEVVSAGFTQTLHFVCTCYSLCKPLINMHHVSNVKFEKRGGIDFNVLFAFLREECEWVMMEWVALGWSLDYIMHELAIKWDIRIEKDCWIGPKGAHWVPHLFPHKLEKKAAFLSTIAPLSRI